MDNPTVVHKTEIVDPLLRTVTILVIPLNFYRKLTNFYFKSILRLTRAVTNYLLAYREKTFTTDLKFQSGNFSIQSVFFCLYCVVIKK